MEVRNWKDEGSVSTSDIYKLGYWRNVGLLPWRGLEGGWPHAKEAHNSYILYFIWRIVRSNIDWLYRRSYLLINTCSSLLTHRVTIFQAVSVCELRVLRGLGIHHNSPCTISHSLFPFWLRTLPESWIHNKTKSIHGLSRRPRISNEFLIYWNLSSPLSVSPS